MLRPIQGMAEITARAPGADDGPSKAEKKYEAGGDHQSYQQGAG